MGVYFAPQQKSWLDYAGPIVAQIIGDAMGRTDRANQYKMQQRTAEEEMARKQQMAQWQAEQLYGTQKQRPLNGPEQALGIAGYTPGGQLPATNETYREGGILNGMDMRGNPNDAFGRIAAGMQFMDPEAMKQMQHILGSLNPAQSFQSIEQGDKVTAGAFDPLTGAFGGQEYGVGIDPTKEMESVNDLEGRKILANAQLGAARLNASRPHAPRAERKPAALRPIQTDQGIMLLNPETGEITPTGIKPPAKDGSAGAAKLEEFANEDQDEEKDGGWLSLLKSLFGDMFEDNPAQASQAPQAPQQSPQLKFGGYNPNLAFPLGFSNFENGANLGLWPGSQEDPRIEQMMALTGLPREEVIKRLQQQQNGMF